MKKLNGFKCYIRAVIKDKEGNVIKDTGWKETNLLVQNFFRHLRAAFGNIDTSGVRTDGLTYSIRRPAFGAYDFMRADGPETDDSYGIVVGTGTKAPALDDYNLDAKITHGTGTGQLYYFATSITLGNGYVETTRSFQNLSGADITINEVGLVCVSIADGLTSMFLITRSLFTITVANGATITLYYRIGG